MPIAGTDIKKINAIQKPISFFCILELLKSPRIYLPSLSNWYGPWSLKKKISTPNEAIQVEIVKLFFNDKSAHTYIKYPNPVAIDSVSNPKRIVYQIAAQLLLPNPK